MADDDPADIGRDARDDKIVAALAEQLSQSRQQQSRLRDALTRVLSLVEEADRAG